ncbi:MAG: YdcF family protein [Bacteroidota bacterium]
MFFILSKILSFLIQPFLWVVGLLLFALFSKSRSRKKKALLAAIIMIYFFGNHIIFNQVVKLWESKTITADQIVRPYKVGILLGGYSNNSILPRHDRQNFNKSGNRFFNAYELYQTGKVEKLLLTGGSGKLLDRTYLEAESMKEYLMKMGVPEEDILVDTKSRNTYENAIYSKEILEAANIRGNYLLITSAWHMRRAKACFDKAGVSYTPYSVDFLTVEDNWQIGSFLLPNPYRFSHWQLLIKEWAGMLAYKMKGYI